MRTNSRTYTGRDGEPRGRHGLTAAAVVAAMAGLAAGLGALWAAGEAFGQTAPAQPAQPSGGGPAATVTQPAGDFSGRDFGGLRVPSPQQRGDLVLRSSRAWVWADGGGGGGAIGVDGLPVGTQRMLLQGDVRVEIGGYTFSAAQAVAWVQALGPSEVNPNDPDRRVRQIAIQFDRVSDPTADAAFSQAADRLLVTATLDGTLTLGADALTPGRPGAPAQATFITESEERFARYLRSLTGEKVSADDVRGTPQPGTGGDRIAPGMSRPYEPLSPLARRQGARTTEEAGLSIEQRVEPLFAKSGVVTFAVGTRMATSPAAPAFDPTGAEATGSEYIKLVRGTDDNTLLLTGGVAVQYTDFRKTRNLLITADRAVVFLPPGPLSDMTRFGSDAVRGVYLEGDVVATDGQYTLRGPRVYYDFQKNQALMPDAVFSTVDARTGTLVYVRARALRQEAANQVKAEGARISTSSFFEPVFSVGAKSVTVTTAPEPKEGGRPRTFVDVRGLTFRAGGVPFFWLPGFKGEVQELPLEDIRVENSSGSGGALKTTWNAFGLFGVDTPRGIKVRALIDGYFDRGVGLGTRSDWDRDDHKGQLFAYMLPHDEGRDVFSTGAKKGRDGDFRGIFLADETWKLDPNWTLQLEGAHVSDPAFVDAFFKDLAQEGRELATSANLRYIGGNSEFSVLAKGTFMDFTPNQYLLESQGYTVDKLPEVRYTRLADDLLPGVRPGLLTWSHDYRYTRAGFKFNEPRVSEFGFTNNFLSQRAFGVNANQSIADRLRAAGFTEEYVNRADTRQELSAVIDLGPFRVNPFAVGRFTGYDSEFRDFYRPSVDGDEQYRGWWAAGARVSTEITRVDDSVDSELFDLHRVRHIVEPNATVWSAGSTIREESLPVYDQDVEGIGTGTAVRAGVSQTWQTQRGGPGRWRSVDVLKVRTDFTFSSHDINQKSPLERFIDYRPEYSFLGNFFDGEVQWQMTDAVGIVAGTVYDFDLRQPQRTTAGGVIQHSPEFSTYAQVRYLNALDSTYVDFGANYQLTRLYALGTQITYDTNRGEVQSVSATLRRRFQDATLGVRLSYNDITEETGISAIFEPFAAQGAREQKSDRLREIGR